MSQEQPQRPQETGQQQQKEPIKYGDIFQVSGDLASKLIAPQDAATVQAAENLVLGQTQKGGPAATMQSAAQKNETAGLVGHQQATDVADKEGVTIAEAHFEGSRIVTESVAGQVLGQYIIPEQVEMKSPSSALDGDAITIGEALEASALSAGNKPVEQSDAAAIQAAEMRAAGFIAPGGVGSTAQSAASVNAHIMDDAQKVMLSDILTDATTKLTRDKAVTREDAERVIGAEIRNKLDLTTDPCGVGASVAAAARLNQDVV